MSLSWNANPAGDLVDRYQVYRNDSLIADGPTATSYTDTGVTNGTTYNYRVSAHNSVGYGNWTATPVPATPAGASVAPVANFTATPTAGSAPLTVQFTNTSTGSPMSYAWDFDNNGSTDSTAAGPSHTYSTAGTYTVKLIVTNPQGTDSEVKPGYIVVSAGGGTVYWTGDFETGNFSQWDRVADGTTDPANGNTIAQIVTAPKRAGNYAARCTNGPYSGSTDRCEIGASQSKVHGYDGQESYQSFSVYFPLSNKGKWAPNVWAWNNIWQMIDYPGPGPCVNMHLGIATGTYGTDYPHFSMSMDVDAAGNCVPQTELLDLGQIPYDTWTDFVFHFRWSMTNTGIFEVWKNGTLVISRTGIRNLTGGPVYTEIQNYGPPPTGQVSVYFDSIKVGSSYSAVSP